MSKGEIKQSIAILLLGILNIIICFFISNFFGFSNVLFFHSFSVLYGDITWEVVIFLVLSLLEAIIYGFYSGEIEELFENNY